MFTGTVKRAFLDRCTKRPFHPGDLYQSADQGRMQELAEKGYVEFAEPSGAPVQDAPEPSDAPVPEAPEPSDTPVQDVPKPPNAPVPEAPKPPDAPVQDTPKPTRRKAGG